MGGKFSKELLLPVFTRLALRQASDFPQRKMMETRGKGLYFPEATNFPVCRENRALERVLRGI